MDMNIEAVLLQMRVVHTIQTANLIDQAKALFNLEEILKQEAKNDHHRNRSRTKRRDSGDGRKRDLVTSNAR